MEIFQCGISSNLKKVGEIQTEYDRYVLFRLDFIRSKESRRNREGCRNCKSLVLTKPDSILLSFKWGECFILCNASAPLSQGEIKALIYRKKKVEEELVQQLKENRHIREKFQKTWKIFMTFAIKGGVECY